MFDSAVVRRVGQVGAVDAGLIAETLLFYRQTHVILDNGTAVTLVRTLGIENLLRLVEQGDVRLTSLRHTLGTMTERDTGVPLHKFVEFRLTGNASTPGKAWDRERALVEAFVAAEFPRHEAKSIVTRLIDVAPVERLGPLRGYPEIAKLAEDDLRDTRYAETAAKLIVEDAIGGAKLPENWRFIIRELEEGKFFVETNFDFSQINERFQRLVPYGNLSEATVLNEILESRADMLFGSKHMAEVVTNSARSRVMKAKFDLLNMARALSLADIAMFEDVYLEGRRLKDAINSGERSFDEFMVLLDGSRRFKKWLNEGDTDIGLPKAYYDEVTKSSWLDSLPTKVTRFLLMTGAGALIDVLTSGGVGTLAGLALGTADTFMLDKMLKGWRPNQFVENDLSAFLRQRS